jgi:putative membrane protein insertion efficiency factor
VALLIGVDTTRDPRRQLSVRVAITALRVHRATTAQWLELTGVTCRFAPSCSRYAQTCLERFGIVRGSFLTARRLLRCGPWTPAGTVDPPPPDLAPPGDEGLSSLE